LSGRFRERINKGKEQLVIHNLSGHGHLQSSCLYKSFQLQSLKDNSNRVSQCRNLGWSPENLDCNKIINNFITLINDQVHGIQSCTVSLGARKSENGRHLSCCISHSRALSIVTSP